MWAVAASAQRRSVVAVGAALSACWLPTQAVVTLQTRSVVTVPADRSYSVASQTVSRPHRRSEVALGEVCSYVLPAVQMGVRVAHVRSVEMVGARVSYWLAGSHRVTAAQTRSEVAVPGADSYLQVKANDERRIEKSKSKSARNQLEISSLLWIVISSARAKSAALPVILSIIGPREIHDYRELDL